MSDSSEYDSSDDENSKKASYSPSKSPIGLYSMHDGTNGAVSSSDDCSSSNDDYNFSTYRSKALNHEEIKNHLKGNLSFGLPTKCKNDWKSPSTTAVGQILLQQLTQPRMDNIAKEIEATDSLKDQREDIKQGYRIVRELMSPHLQNISSIFKSENKNHAQLTEVTKNPLCLPKIRDNIISGEYETIVEVIKDLRVMIQNVYIFYGPMHSNTKKALHLEFHLERKLAALPDETKKECTLENTNNITLKEEEVAQTKSSRICIKGEIYFSRLLYCVRGCKLAREKEQKLKRIEARRKAKRDKEMVFFQWEEKAFEESFGTQIKAMWELPQIGQFLVLSLPALNIFEISQYEVERMLLVPEYSTNLKMLITSLLSSPVHRQKIGDKPYMPYNVWANKLATKVQQWYKIYKREKCNAAKVSEQLGIDPQFWSVCGTEWPFKCSLFHELEFYKRVWLLKSLCDFVAHNHKSVQETIMDQPEDNLRERILGTDRERNEYIYFPQFYNYNLRIYRRSPLINAEEEELNNTLEEKKCDEKVFSKEQIKYYNSVLKQSKRKIQNEDVWEYKGAKKKKSTSRRPKAPPRPSSPATPRSRPGNLRQRPTQRVLIEAENLSECSSEEEVVYNLATSFATIAEEDSGSNTPGASKSYPKRKGKRVSHTCLDCGKEFSTLASLNGHLATHSRKKRTKVRSTRQFPEIEDENAKEETSCQQPKIPDESSTESVNSQDTTSLNNLNEPSEVAIKETKGGVLKGEDGKNDIVKGEKDNCVVKEEPDIKEEMSIKSEQDCKEEVVDTKSGLFDVKDSKNGIKSSESIADSDVPCETNQLSADVKKEHIISALQDEGKEITEANGILSQSSEKSPEIAEDDKTTETQSQKDKDILWKFCDPNVFNLVASTVEDLRMLIKKFGPVPSKMSKEPKESPLADCDVKSVNEANDEEDEERDDKEDNEENNNFEKDLPDCEKALYKGLCDLLAEFSPYESKYKTLHKQVIKKMFKEENEWKTRTSIYGDPDEEAWKSDPEPEPEPVQEAPPVSSSSSSSVEEFYDDGARKRKLRKRKGRPARNTPLSGSREQTPVPSPESDEEQETTTVSSRGRVRRVKKLVNYDKLDFDKLFEEAKMDTDVERERKRRKKDYDREELKSAAEFFKMPSEGVQRYLLSKTGDPVGYIDTAGKTHYRTRPEATFKPPANPPQSNLDPNKIPTMAVAAGTRDGKEVMVKVSGSHTQNFLAKVEKEGKSSNRTITVTNNGQEYMFPLNSTFYTRNVPGYPDCEIPHTPPKKAIQRIPIIPKTGMEPSKLPQNQTASSSNIRTLNVAARENGSTAGSSEPQLATATQATACKRIMLKTAKGPVQINVPHSLASQLAQGQVRTVNTLSNTSHGYVVAGPSGDSNHPKLTNPIKLYKPSLPSNILGATSTPTPTRYVIMNQPTTPVHTVSTQPTTNNFIQINNANNSPLIQIQQPSNVIHYSAPTNTPILQVLPQTTPTVSQSTFVPVANATIGQQSAFIQSTPVYNQVIVQQPQIHIPSQPVLIPQTVQQLAAPVSSVTPLPSVTQVQNSTAAGTKGPSKILLINTNEGQKICLQTTEGKLVILTNEQIQVLAKRGAIKPNPV